MAVFVLHNFNRALFILLKPLWIWACSLTVERCCCHNGDTGAIPARSTGARKGVYYIYASLLHSHPARYDPRRVYWRAANVVVGEDVVRWPEEAVVDAAGERDRCGVDDALYSCGDIGACGVELAGHAGSRAHRYAFYLERRRECFMELNLIFF